MRHPGKTPPFRGPQGEILYGSIAEVGYRRVGGLDQWTMIRGESIANPPLILLHGGPGLSETALFRYFNAPLEKRFTVVYWDQRGAGKSFYRNIPRSSMTVEQFIADLDELVEYVCERLGKTKVAIFGHSWGSVLGPLYAARFPEKVGAYVGSGQIGDWAAAEVATYAFALAEAERLGKRRAVKKLRAIGPPPHTAQSLRTQRTLLSRQRLNLIELAPTLQAPVFFFLGRKDHWVPVENSLAYLDALAAPSKELVWFEESGHEPFMDEPTKFNTATTELVRPVLSSGASSAG